MKRTFDKARAERSTRPIPSKDDLSPRHPGLAEPLDLPKTSEGLLVPGVGRLPHLKVPSEAFMEVVSQEEVTVSAASPVATALEASAAAVHRVVFLPAVVPAAFPAAVEVMAEVIDNDQVVRPFSSIEKKQDPWSCFFCAASLLI